MSKRRSEESQRRVEIWWLFAALPVAVVLGLSLALGLGADRDDASSGTTETGTTSVNSATSPGNDGAEESREPSGAEAKAACQAELQATSGVARAYRLGVANWRGHVAARQAWLDGDIDEEEKKARYKATRLRGPADLARRDAALAAYREVKGGCAAMPEDQPGVRSCMNWLDTARGTLAAGKDAFGDWERHLANMAAHAEGEFGDEMAQQMWEKSLSTALPNLQAYADARRDLRRSSTCDLA
ncbi:MAG: hypothetical protein ACRCYQ_14915 [Nocardioides sp.]